MERTDLESWDGNFDELVAGADDLADDRELCERVFSDKREAFLAGRYVADCSSDRTRR